MYMPSDPLRTFRCLQCGGVQSLPTPPPDQHLHCPNKGCSGDMVDLAEALTARSDVPAEVTGAAAQPRNLVGKYVLVSELGHGGMGTVLKAWDTSLRRFVAIKFLNGFGSEEDLQRFYREAQTAAAIQHPNIAAIFEVGESEGKPFIAMEYLDGKPLSGQKPGVRRACEIMRDAALALGEAHRRSIIHRDIKPSNILLDKTGRAAIVDFGLAKYTKDVGRLTASGTVVGTPCYMAPEQAKGLSKRLDRRTDVYQLGATLYELVTGQPPFRGNSAPEILRKVVEEDVVRPSQLGNVPRDVETIILRALEKEPDRRYATAGQFAEDLERYLEGRPISARRSSTVYRLSRFVVRHRAAAVAAVALAILAIVGFGYLLHRASVKKELAGYLRDARHFYTLGEWQKALEHYSSAEPLAPGSKEIVDRLAECRGRLERAAEEARTRESEARIRELETRKLEIARKRARPAYDRGKAELEEATKDLYRRGADLVMTRNRLVSAIAALSDSLTVWPDNPDALLARGRAHALRFEAEEAEKDFSRALELRPEFPAAREARGKLLLQRYIDAKLHLGWIWDKTVSRPFASWKEQARADLIDEAFLAFAEDRLNDCLRHCDKRLMDRPELEEVHKLKGDALLFGTGMSIHGRLNPLQQSLVEEAVLAYDEALRLRPNYYEARMMRGYALLQEGEGARAIEDVQVALRLRPDDALAYWFMGQTATDPQDSFEWYDKGFKVRPDSFICRMNRASALGMLGRYREAQEELDRSIGMNPAHYYTFYLRGALRSKTGDMEGAYHDFRKTTKMNAGFQSGWFNLGATAYNTKRYREAVQAFEAALQTGHPQREQILRLLQQARARLGS